MSIFSFNEQEKLLEIAINILEDYSVYSWSLGGGTALAAAYYNHRMSYDIDIFSEDFSGITKLISFKEEIASNLKIDISQVQSSSSGITFVLSNEGHQLKLDFLYRTSLTDTPYNIINVLNKDNIVVQTPFEIIAKKLKHREILTIRDFVDFAYAERKEGLISKIKYSGILDCDRFIDVWKQFDDILGVDFDLELKYLNPIFMKSKQCIYKELFLAFNPKDEISIAVNEDFELLTFDSWIEECRDDYESVGEYHIYEHISKDKIAQVISKNSSDMTYNDIYELKKEQVKELLSLL